MEFDKGLELAVTLGWNDLTAGDQLVSARVEYESKQGKPVDCLTVWTVRSWGYQDRVCDYWTPASAVTPKGVHFSHNYRSEALTKALDFIMQNQGQFTRPSDAGRSQLVLIQPPPADLVAEASAWMTGIEASAKRAGGTEAKQESRAITRPGRNGAAPDPGATATDANRSCQDMGNRSGFPNGPWRR